MVGAALSVVVGLVARRMRALTWSGAATATVIGTIAVTAGWAWGALLISLFISVAVLSRLGEKEKSRRLGGMLQKGEERDAAQVIANGAVFTIAATASLVSPGTYWYAIAAGALAFSAADTWGTEIGTLTRHEPRSITSGRKVPVGTSGGISVPGTLAAVAGALFIGAATWFAAWPIPLTAVALGGVLAAVADSLIGATIQEKRFCPRCNKLTERTVHDCGTPTTITGGIPQFGNEAVNATCSAIGALIALGLTMISRRI